MNNLSFCGADCTACQMNTVCRGCAASDGHPFGEACMVAGLCKCEENTFRTFEQKLIGALNALNIEKMESVTELYPLRGAFINMEYTLPGGQSTKFWNDNKIYLGNQLQQKDSGRCYGIAADEKYLLICEYDADGANPELVTFQRWN